MAVADVETLVSTRLDPGIDPIVEADRRGSILAIVRLGNKDLELPGADAGTDSGIVTFDVAPTAGVVITAGYTFDVPVRFREHAATRLCR